MPFMDRFKIMKDDKIWVTNWLGHLNGNWINHYQKNNIVPTTKN
jgi:hypothetical protein